MIDGTGPWTKRPRITILMIGPALRLKQYAMALGLRSFPAALEQNGRG